MDQPSREVDPKGNLPLPAQGWRLSHTYADLPAVFFTEVDPTPVAAPHLTLFNQTLARSLGLSAEALSGAEGSEIFSGNRLPDGAKPLAQAYAGHQYGHFTVLGDGRAILLGEQITPSGARFDIQLKGSGPTPYSRRGDGRAALGPMLREYIISEAMAALGIPTTRSLAVASTGDTIWREQPSAGAVLTRVASSHLRVGTFQWAALQRDEASLQRLVDYALWRHYPESVNSPTPALALLRGVMQRQAVLLAQWMQVGFVHGVMNTDNMAISGETIDYGPCAFIDSYEPGKTFSSIDRHGRYAFGEQPRIAQWNLARLAETLLPLIDPVEEKAVEKATDEIRSFTAHYQTAWLGGMRRKLGLFGEEPDDEALVDRLLHWMQLSNADFTLTFASLATTRTVSFAKEDDTTLAAWLIDWQQRLARQAQSETESRQLSQTSCPAVIPRNHLVEEALSSAVEGNLAPLHGLLEVLSAPFNHGRPADRYTLPPETPVENYQTFCGT